MAMQLRFCLVFLLSAYLVTLPVHASQQCANLLFATGYDGKPAAGAKAVLVEAIQRGEPVRIGWELDFDGDGEANVSHWSAAAFLSVAQGEAFAQVSAVQRQRPRGGGRIEFADAFTEWRGMLGTDGSLQGAFSDGSPFPDDLSVRITWCGALPPRPQWVAVYRNGIDGEALEGSKDALLAAIRAGQPIQIGWGFSAERDGKALSVEHTISPEFLTIVGGDHVAAQLPEHIAQQGYVNIDRALFDDGAVMWRGLMTTRGTFDAIWVNRATGEIVRRYPQRAMMTWYAQHPAASDTPPLAVPGGVTRDKARAGDVVPR
ncbi:MAG: hypothetical protein AAFN78_03870 [Pseudomonadota bacterium]